MLEENIYIWEELSSLERQNVLQRPHLAAQGQLQVKVANILAHIKSKGQKAVLEYAATFDGFTGSNLALPKKAWEAAEEQLSIKEQNAIATAYEQIKAFHQLDFPQDQHFQSTKDIRLTKTYRPIEKVGLYIPGGSAPLPSTVLMLGVPAQLAGCKEVVLTTPPQPDGSIHPAIIYAARLCGIHQIFTVGGAQAIGAMAYGTLEVPKVHKVFGPGNAWVTEAKQQVARDPQGAALDMPAGPSEVMVTCDQDSNAAFVALDMLSQAEHGPDSQAMVISECRSFLDRVVKEITLQLPQLSRREICQESLAHARFIHAKGRDSALEIINAYAPEHLIIHNSDHDQWIDHILHAGSIFLGSYTPESLGDYASGTNHVLPTYGYARAFSGLCVRSFLKHITIQKASISGLKMIGPTVATLASLEGLEAHKRAVTARLQSNERSAES